MKLQESRNRAHEAQNVRKFGDGKTRTTSVPSKPQAQPEEVTYEAQLGLETKSRKLIHDWLPL